MGKQATGASAAHDVVDGVEDLAQGMYSRAPRGFRGRDMGLDVGPFGIGGVALEGSLPLIYR